MHKPKEGLNKNCNKTHNAQFSPLSFAYHLNNDMSANPLKENRFLDNKSEHNIALLMIKSVLLVLKCHNIDICQRTCAYTLLECSKLEQGKFNLLDIWVFHRV